MAPRRLVIISIGSLVAVSIILLVGNNRKKTPELVGPLQVERPKETSMGAPSLRASENPDRFDWGKIESSDYREYIRNLRSIGTPEETIQDIIIADINKLYEIRRKQMMKSYPPPPGAVVGIRPYTAVRERLEADARALQAEKRSLVKELLGENVDVKEEPIEIAKEDVQHILMSFLPPEKQESAKHVLRTFDSRFQSEVTPILDGPFDQNERAAYIKFREEKDQALQGILTPSEKEEYDLRFSQLSGSLHNRFEGFQLSETAFKELYRFAKNYENGFDYYLIDSGDNEITKARQEAQMAVFLKAQELSQGAVSGRPGGQLSQRFGF